MQPHIRAFVERAVTFTTCPDCERHPAQRGRPVVPHRRASTSPMRARCRSATSPPGCAASTSRRWHRCSRRCARRSTRSCEIGLGYLSLDRPSGTLSGGEAQRTKMIRHLGSSLTDVTYVFDEPTIGLHPHDIAADERAAAAAARQGQHRARRRAQARGHRDRRPRGRPRARRRARPAARSSSRAPSTGCARATRSPAATWTTARALKPTVRHAHRARSRSAARTRTTCGRRRRHPARRARRGHRRRRLRQELARPRLDARPAPGVVSIDQGAIHGSRRSNPATYTGLLEPIRKAFAKANGVKPALFSANSEGACPACNGAGVIYTDLGIMAGVVDRVRGLRGQAVPAPRCSSTSSAARTSARCSRCR